MFGQNSIDFVDGIDIGDINTFGTVDGKTSYQRALFLFVTAVGSTCTANATALAAAATVIVALFVGGKRGGIRTLTASCRSSSIRSGGCAVECRCQDLDQGRRCQSQKGIQGRTATSI